MNRSPKKKFLWLIATLIATLVAIAAPMSDELLEHARARLQNYLPVSAAEMAARVAEKDQAATPSAVDEKALKTAELEKLAKEKIAADGSQTTDQQAAEWRERAKEISEHSARGEELTISEKAILSEYESLEFSSAERRERREELDDNGGSTFVYSGAALRIPPGTGTGGTGDDSTRGVITVSGLGTILDVEVQIDSLTHTFDGDMDIYLVSPSGTRLELSTDNGSTGDNYIRTRFDDDAATLISAGTAPFTNTYRPEFALSAFDGQSANGNWTLLIDDDAGGDTGFLYAWHIQILASGAGTPHDYAAIGVLSPTAGPYAPGAVLPVSVRFSNVGTTTESSPVHYSFNGGATVDAVTDVLPQGGIDTVTFTGNITLPGVDGTYVLTTWCTLTGDTTRINDTNRVNVVVRGGDDCSAAIQLAGSSGSGTWNNCGFTDNTPGQSCGSSDNDMVFTLTAQPGAFVSIQQPSNLIDSRHSLRWGGACPGDSLVGCVDDPDNTTFTWTNNTGIVQNVYVIVGGWTLGTTCGDFTLNWINTIDSCAAPSINVPAVSNVGSVTLTATVSGGFGGTPVLQWYTGLGCVAGNEITGANATTYATTVSGVFSCRAFILDSVGCAACDSAEATVLPPPPGDLCSIAIPLTGESGSGTWNNCGYSDNTPGQSCGSSDNDIVFSLVAAPGAFVSIQQPSNLIDSRHSVRWGGACPGDSLVGCVDDPDNTAFTWTNNTGVTQNVYAIVGGWSIGTTCGDFTLNWTNTTDSCAAPSIDVPAASAVGSVTLTAAVTGGFGGTPILQWYNGVGCVPGNEIAGATASTYTTAASGIFSCRAFILDSVGCAACDSAEATVLPVPPGDQCSNAFDITYPFIDDSASWSGSTTGAVADCIDSCNSTIARSAGPDYFATITLPTCRRLEFNLDNGTQGSGDMYIAVYAGGLGGCCTQTILCNDDVSAFPTLVWSAHRNSTSLNSYVAGELAAGTYYIRVAYYSTGSGAFRLRIYDSGPCACEVSCVGGDVIEAAEDRFNLDFYLNDPNGGCNNTVPAFATANCGQTVCGQLFNYLNHATSGYRAYYRDTDWYTLNVTDSGAVALSLTTTAPVYITVVDSNTCPPTILLTDSADACSSRTITAPLTAGQYTGVVTLKSTVGYPTPVHYRVGVVCPNPCVLDTVVDLTARFVNEDADPTANDIRLRWSADPGFLGTYSVWTNTVDGPFPGTWTQLVTGIGPNGLNTTYTHDDGATLQRRFYIVTGVCP